MTLLRVTAPLASLLFFSSFASAQVYAANCTLATWNWTFNSLSQSPCAVAAYLMATCDNGAYTLGPEPSGYTYFGPSSSAAADLCYCNTVGYSLFSACAACQGNEWIAWSVWATNCTKTLPPSSFPNPVPSEIRVPQWALIDITNENYWNSSQSYAVGDTPEVGPGSIIAPSTSSTAVSATSSSYPYSTGSPTHASSGGSGSGSNPGAIVGGVVGGIAAICIAVAVIFFRRRHSQAQPAVSADVIESKVLPSMPDEGTTTPSSLSGSPITRRFYDPDDPTTFPGYQAGLHSLDIPSQTSNIGSGSTLVNAQTSLPHARGYHGRPIV